MQCTRGMLSRGNLPPMYTNLAAASCWSVLACSTRIARQTCEPGVYGAWLVEPSQLARLLRAVVNEPRLPWYTLCDIGSLHVAGQHAVCML